LRLSSFTRRQTHANPHRWQTAGPAQSGTKVYGFCHQSYRKKYVRAAGKRRRPIFGEKAPIHRPPVPTVPLCPNAKSLSGIPFVRTLRDDGFIGSRNPLNPARLEKL
jgi:hypothetical protein